MVYALLTGHVTPFLWTMQQKQPCFECPNVDKIIKKLIK